MRIRSQDKSCIQATYLVKNQPSDVKGLCIFGITVLFYLLPEFGWRNWARSIYQSMELFPLVTHDWYQQLSDGFLRGWTYLEQ